LKLGAALLSIAVLAALTVPAAAQAPGPAIALNKKCYEAAAPGAAAGEPVSFTATGFPPGGSVAISRDGASLGTLTAGSTGSVTGRLPAPAIDPKQERRFSITATSQLNPAITATVNPLATALNVTVKPKTGKPGVKRRISARGFNVKGAKYLYAHVRGRAKKNIRLGRIRGACGKSKARKRILRNNAKSGSYRVQFDTHKKYKKTRIPRVTYLITVFRTFKSGASAATVGERWVRLD
jgi:hypothetical protein